MMLRVAEAYDGTNSTASYDGTNAGASERNEALFLIEFGRGVVVLEAAD